MTKKKQLTQDNSKALEGTIYQFYETIDWCWKLKKNQCLQIEKYGDISVAGDSNIEVKKYSDKLTNSHKNLWNTLGGCPRTKN